jgi:hypothetical protein
MSDRFLLVMLLLLGLSVLTISTCSLAQADLTTQSDSGDIW